MTHHKELADLYRADLEWKAGVTAAMASLHAGNPISKMQIQVITNSFALLDSGYRGLITRSNRLHEAEVKLQKKDCGEDQT